MNGWKITPLLCASVLWGTTGTAQALAHLHPAPPAIGAARLLSGGLALWLVIAVRGRIALRELMAPGRRPWFLGASLATAIYQAAFFAAVARTGVALGTLVALGSAPAFCGVLARELAGERLPAAWTLSTACAVVGCVLLLAPSGHAGADPLGIALSLVAGACYGTYTVCVKRLLSDDADPLSVLVATVSTAR
jgi:drug/metabolite transporter (DMT)-like permease